LVPATGALAVSGGTEDAEGTDGWVASPTGGGGAIDATGGIGCITGAGGKADVALMGVASSSSWGFNSSEISTLAGGGRIGGFCNAIICAIHSVQVLLLSFVCMAV
jgi:hypothetical protein